jgi:hypothetical protein
MQIVSTRRQGRVEPRHLGLEISPEALGHPAQAVRLRRPHADALPAPRPQST